MAARAGPLRRLSQSDDPLVVYGLVHAASAAGDALVAIALADSIFFSLPVGEAKVRVALYLALTMAPLALAAPLLVPLLDRGGFRRALSFMAGGARAVAAFYAAPRLDSHLLFPAIFLVLVLSKIHGITKNGLTVAYTPADRSLVGANARLARMAVAGAFVSAAAGLGVLRLAGPTAVLYAAAGVYAASALLNLRLRQPEAVRQAPTSVSPRGRIGELGLAAVGTAGLRAAHGFLLFLLAFALRRSGDPAYWLGALIAAGMAGALLANLLAPRLPEGLGEEAVVLLSLLGAGVGALIALRVFSLPVLAAFSGVAGGATELGRLAFMSLMQRLAPRSAHGRVFVRYEVGFQLAWVGGALLPAILPISHRLGLAILGASYLALSAGSILRPLLPARPEARGTGSDVPRHRGSGGR